MPLTILYRTVFVKKEFVFFKLSITFQVILWYFCHISKCI